MEPKLADKWWEDASISKQGQFRFTRDGSAKMGGCRQVAIYNSKRVCPGMTGDKSI